MSPSTNEKLQCESHACRKLLFTATNIYSYLCRPTQMRISCKVIIEFHACRKLLFTATNIYSYLCRLTEIRSCKVNLMHAESHCLLRQTYIRTCVVQHNEKLQGEFHACRKLLFTAKNLYSYLCHPTQ